MKISTFILSFGGFCIFYICNADWMDDLYERIFEDYLGGDYEEVPPFISSISAGTEEFDKLVEELAQSKRKWYPTVLTVMSTAVVIIFSAFLCQYALLRKGHGLLLMAQKLLRSYSRSRNTIQSNKEEIQNLVVEFFDSKIKRFYKTKERDDVPVELLWKGGSLIESSIHCNIRDDSTGSRIQNLHKQLFQSKIMLKTNDAGGGDEGDELFHFPSEESTTRKMTEIRKLLDSDAEIIKRCIDKKTEGGNMKSVEGCELEESKEWKSEKRQRCHSQQRASFVKRSQNSVLRSKIPEEDQIEEQILELNEKLRTLSDDSLESIDNRADQSESERPDSKEDHLDCNCHPDQRLLNRIRVLENRLRLEELKNKNWISRMSRAEGILQQLNKQVERIEETRPLGTLTETLKITSTVTNWPSHPRRNMQYTLVNQYPNSYLQTPYMSLSDVIKREIGLPPLNDYRKVLCHLPHTPQLPTLSTLPQSSFLSKFLNR